MQDLVFMGDGFPLGQGKAIILKTGQSILFKTTPFSTFVSPGDSSCLVNNEPITDHRCPKRTDFAISPWVRIPHRR